MFEFKNLDERMGFARILTCNRWKFITVKFQIDFMHYGLARLCPPQSHGPYQNIDRFLLHYRGLFYACDVLDLVPGGGGGGAHSHTSWLPTRVHQPLKLTLEMAYRTMFEFKNLDERMGFGNLTLKVEFITVKFQIDFMHYGLARLY